MVLFILVEVWTLREFILIKISSVELIRDSRKLQSHKISLFSQLANQKDANFKMNLTLNVLLVYFFGSIMCMQLNQYVRFLINIFHFDFIKILTFKHRTKNLDS